MKRWFNLKPKRATLPGKGITRFLQNARNLIAKEGGMCLLYGQKPVAVNYERP